MISFLKIINFLGRHYSELFTMHELSEILDIPYASFHRCVKGMEKQGILNIEEIGRSKVVKLSLNHPVLKSHLTASSFDEMQEFLEEHPIIKKIVNELKTNDIVLLFVSYAKGKETGKSDIDLLIINKGGDRSLSFSAFELLYKKKINSIFITRKEFKDMLRDKEENVGKQALNNHIILNNPEGFCGLVLDAIR